MMAYLTAFFEIFRFIKRYRERRLADIQREADERAAERDHQFRMLETIFTKMMETQKVQSDSVYALAESNKAYAEVMKTWLDGFKITDPTPAKPIPSERIPSNPAMDELLEMQELGIIDPLDPESIPAELRQAYLLAQQERAEASKG